MQHALLQVNGMLLEGKKVYVGPFVQRGERPGGESARRCLLVDLLPSCVAVIASRQMVVASKRSRAARTASHCARHRLLHRL